MPGGKVIHQLDRVFHVIEIGIDDGRAVEHHLDLPPIRGNFLLVPLPDRVEMSALGRDEQGEFPNAE